MEYIHIRNLERYHPGYRDRNLLWAKIWFGMVQGDPEFELIDNEIDKWRFVAMICLELAAKKPLPNSDKYWQSKGFKIKKRPMSLTLQMLHNFIEVVTEPLHNFQPTVYRSREEVDKEVDKDSKCVTEFFNYFLLKTKKSLKLTPERKTIIEHRLKEGRTLEQLKQAVDNFVLDDWQDRHKFIDIPYCIGIRNKIDNLDRWLTVKSKRPEPKRDPNCPICDIHGKIKDGAQKGGTCICVK